MRDKHFTQWKNMMDDNSWLAPNWSSLYRTKAFHDFVWHSTEDYGDDDLRVLRKKIKRIIVELILSVVMVFVVTILFINLRLLQ
jgi:hypothetical protein